MSRSLNQGRLPRPGSPNGGGYNQNTTIEDFDGTGFESRVFAGEVNKNRWRSSSFKAQSRVHGSGFSDPRRRDPRPFIQALGSQSPVERVDWLPCPDPYPSFRNSDSVQAPRPMGSLRDAKTTLQAYTMNARDRRSRTPQTRIWLLALGAALPLSGCKEPDSSGQAQRSALESETFAAQAQESATQAQAFQGQAQESATQAETFQVQAQESASQAETFAQQAEQRATEAAAASKEVTDLVNQLRAALRKIEGDQKSGEIGTVKSVQDIVDEAEDRNRAQETDESIRKIKEAKEKAKAKGILLR